MPQARHVALRLLGAGFETWFVGGCVRDLLGGETPNDVDLATAARPEQVLALFPLARAVGAAFGVVLVQYGGKSFEVATFREDGAYTDCRRPDSVRFATAREDVQRRDFTVNGLLMDPRTGMVADYVGGVEDWKNGLIRAIGDPRARFAEDALRLLRAVRFAATKRMRIETCTWEALCEQAQLVKRVSAERVRAELDRMWASPHRKNALALLDMSGMLGIILPELVAMKGCRQPPQFHPEGDVWEHTKRVFEHLPPAAGLPLAWAALLHDVAKPAVRSVDECGELHFYGHDRLGGEMAETILHRLKYPNALVEVVKFMIGRHMQWEQLDAMRPGKLRLWMSVPTMEDEMLLYRADCLASHGALNKLTYVRECREEMAVAAGQPKPCVTGRDLIAMGLQPGPSFKRWLEDAYIEQLEGRFADRCAALAWVRRHISNTEKDDAAEP